MSIFREEVLYRRRPELHGDVSLALPTNWSVIAVLLLLLSTLLFASLFTISYSRVESVRGEIVWDSGVIEIQASSRGRVDEILVPEGHTVAKGDPVVRIREDIAIEADPGSMKSVIRSLDNRKQLAEERVSADREIFEAKTSQYSVRAEYLREEIENLRRQSDQQRVLVKTAEENLARAEVIAERGFVSQRDLANRQDILTQRRQRLDALEQNRLSLKSDLEETQIERTAEIARWRSDQNAAAAGFAELDEEIARAQRGLNYVIAAPAEGTVAAITTNVGSIANPESSLMYIRPKAKEVIAEIYVPGEIVDRLSEGQLVEFELSAFSANRVTKFEARIVSISQAPVESASISETSQNSDKYLVRAKPTSDRIDENGQIVALRPGIALGLKIELERKSLARWLFDPLLRLT